MVCTSPRCRCGATTPYECNCVRGKDRRCKRCRARIVSDREYERLARRRKKTAAPPTLYVVTNPDIDRRTLHDTLADAEAMVALYPHYDEPLTVHRYRLLATCPRARQLPLSMKEHSR